MAAPGCTRAPGCTPPSRGTHGVHPVWPRAGPGSPSPLRSWWCKLPSPLCTSVGVLPSCLLGFILAPVVCLLIARRVVQTCVLKVVACLLACLLACLPVCVLRPPSLAAAPGSHQRLGHIGAAKARDEREESSAKTTTHERKAVAKARALPVRTSGPGPVLRPPLGADRITPQPDPRGHPSIATLSVPPLLQRGRSSATPSSPAPASALGTTIEEPDTSTVGSDSTKWQHRMRYE